MVHRYRNQSSPRRRHRLALSREARADTGEQVVSDTIDTTKMVELVGCTEVAWRDGLRRMVAARTA